MPDTISRSDFKVVVPLSPLQAAMLRGSLDEWTGSNVEQVEMDFAADLPMEKVLEAWVMTVARTEVLRAAFIVEDGEPTGILKDRGTSSVHVENVIPSSWETWLADDRKKPFRLNGACPWRVVAWPDAGKLVWTFHHALLDGRSIATILRAFQNILTDFDDPGRLDLAVAPAPDDDDVATAERFHRTAFSKVESSQPEFPADISSEPTCVRCCLGAETAIKLEAAALRMEATAPTLLTWAWGQAVACASGQDAVAVGQVRAGAPTPGQAGFTMNTVPLVIDRATQGPVTPVIQKFRESLLEMRGIETVAPQELPSGIFDHTGGPWPGGVVMIQRGSLHHQVGATAGIRAITLHETSDEPLLASAWIHPDLQLEVEVNGHTFGARAAQSLLDHWVSLVIGLAAGSSGDVRDLCSLPQAERDILIDRETGGEQAAHLHLAEAWKDTAERFPANCAIWTPDGSLTYAELAAQVEHLAELLQQNGVRAGQPVASILRIRQNISLVLLALSRLGAINVPLDPTLPENRLKTIIDGAKPVLFLCDRPDDASLFTLPHLVVTGETGKSCSAERPTDPRATLSILYTSGSTGMPKGVMMVHGGVTNEVLGMARLAGISPGDRVLQFASPGFDASLEEILATLLSGATLVPRPENLPADLDEFQNFVRTANIAVLDLSTAHWAAWCAWLVSESLTVPTNVRTVIIGGERASAAALKDWFTAGGQDHLLINTYGPTEASIVGTAELICGDWNEAGDPAIGRPLPGVFARVGDAAGRPMPLGAAGELWLGGICVGSGYWQRQDLTDVAFHFIDDCWWYRTGDRVCWDDAGKLRFLGRQDDQLKIRGNRVEPNEVIRVLEDYPGVSAAHVGPVADEGGALMLAAWVRWNQPPAEGWPGLLAKYAAVHLPTAAIPSRWASVVEFKLTERGKLDRRSLPAPALTASSHASSEPPATPTEKWLADIWSGLLGIRSIGRDESFFELGGHSLAALKLFAKIAREKKVRIPMAALIQAPSLRLLSERIDRETSGTRGFRERESIVVPVRPEGHLPPLFCIHGGDGGVFLYRDLAEVLPPGRPLLAIESPALSADQEVVPVPVEKTAAEYITALRHFQAEGPYHLAGYSYGGLLVYEIARQLMEEGQTIAFAGLFDTINPEIPIHEYSFHERIHVFWDAHHHLKWPIKIRLLLSRFREGLTTHIQVRRETRAVNQSSKSEPHSNLRMLQVRESHWESRQAYRPQPLDCHVSLFKSNAPDDKFNIPPDYGWGRLVKSIDIVEVPGKHLTMFAVRYVANLAKEITSRLDPDSPTSELLTARSDGSGRTESRDKQ